ncbi:MAG: glycoside hydrolase family 32 protein, partial [Clostridia bacterium]|nr:glycoside hydrolase family 32 protein [Clostridia bacterium]
YHLFYQQYPSVDPRQHWGHAISDDMVHWRDLPTAIYPDPEKHVFSGNAVVEEDRVLAMYHGTMRGNMVAQSRDPLLLNWEKITGDAVIPIKEGLPYGIYDPFLRREEDGYYALSGTKVWTPYGHRMAEEQFYSKDLIHWVWLGDLLEENPYLAVNEDGACPYFIPMKDDRYLLFHFSHTSGPHILSGIYNRETHKFRPDAHLKLSSEIPGRGSLNAPCVMSDGSGGGYCIFNCTDGRDTDSESPRSGMMTMMYHVTLDEKNAPVISPLAQYDSLHKELLCDGSFAAKHGERILLPARGRALDIQLTMDLSRSIGFELEVFAGEREKTVIRFVEQNSSHEPRRAYVMVDAGRSSLDPLQYGNVPETADVPVMGDERQLDIRILTDACTVEVFCQGRVVFSTAYPTLPDSDGVFLTGIGGTAVCRNAKIWSMEQIY